MTVVITSWRRGSTSYMSGTRAHSSGGALDSWSCATIDTRNPFKSCSWFGLSGPGYITEGCYNSLTDGEKAQCPSLYQGKVTNSGHWTSYQVEQWTRYIFNPDCIIECWTTACSDLRCKDVVCENVCEDYDLYDSHCEDGVCVRGILIEADNREICDYDPCRNVDCPDECFGEDKWRMECEEGECLPERIIEPNSSECGYVPPDPCEGVVCEDVCDNTNLHESVCDGGSCVRGRLIETDSPTCGYIPPPICNNGETRGKIICEDGSIIYAEICENDTWIPTNATCPTGPTPDPEPDKMPWDMIMLVGIVVVLFYLFITRRG